MGKSYKKPKRTADPPTKRQLEGMVDILRCIENNGIKSSKELGKMMKSAGFQLLTNKSHLKIFNVYGHPVKGRTNRNLIMPKTNLKGETYRDIITDLSIYIREHYNEEIAKSCSSRD